MIRIYVICKLEAYLSMRNWFHPQYGSHFLNIPDGRIIVQANFASEAGETFFTSHPDVEVLPDPTHEGNKPISDAHKKALAHLNLEGDTILHVAHAVGQRHPLMKLRSWM